MQSKSGISKVIVLVMALAMILMMAGMAVVLMKSKGSAKGKAEKVKEVKPTIQVPLGEFVVNLADTTEIRYLKTDLVLEVSGEMPKSEGEGEGECSGLKPLIRDAAIEVMSSKCFAELVKPDGKAQLKKDMIEALNKKLKKNDVGVVDIYFNDFAMQ